MKYLRAFLIVVSLAGSVLADESADKVVLMNMVKEWAPSFERADPAVMIRQFRRNPIRVTSSASIVLKTPKDVMGFLKREFRDRIDKRHLFTVEEVRFLSSDLAALTINHEIGTSWKGLVRAIALRKDNEWGWTLIQRLFVSSENVRRKILDGTEWIAQVENSQEADKIVFQDGWFVSCGAVSRSFYPGEYTAEDLGSKIIWTANMPAYSDENLTWYGELVGSEMSGTVSRDDLSIGESVATPWTAKKLR